MESTFIHPKDLKEAILSMYVPISELSPETVRPGMPVRCGNNMQPGRINYLQLNHPNEPSSAITGAVVLLDTLRSAAYCGDRFPAGQVFVYIGDVQ